MFNLWEISPQLQRFEASQYEPPGQKVILRCFRYSFNFLHIDKTGSTEKLFLGPNRKVVADRAGTNVRIK